MPFESSECNTRQMAVVDTSWLGNFVSVLIRIQILHYLYVLQIVHEKYKIRCSESALAMLNPFYTKCSSFYVPQKAILVRKLRCQYQHRSIIILYNQKSCLFLCFPPFPPPFLSTYRNRLLQINCERVLAVDHSCATPEFLSVWAGHWVVSIQNNTVMTVTKILLINN